jgi:small GTP-binding protein
MMQPLPENGARTPRTVLNSPRAPITPSVSQRYGGNCKIVFIGNAGVGKTEFSFVACDDSVLCRKVGRRTLMGANSTIGVDFQNTTRVNPATTVEMKFQLWDTAGTERYQSLTRAYLNGAAAYIVCYEVTSITSFEQAIKHWLPMTRDFQDNPVVYLLGLKTDLVQSAPKTKAAQPPPRAEVHATNSTNNSNEPVSIETPRNGDESDLLKRSDSQPKYQRQVDTNALALGNKLYAPQHIETEKMLATICGCYETNSVHNNGNDAYDTFTKMAIDIMARIDTDNDPTAAANLILTSQIGRTMPKKKKKC